ncbi:DUF3108 domain-containing protein [Falsiroseomonas sp. HW251]|uniref:DUF3108 domain-containing protein n=1 Tax=Falsiroseomonas sp. HW251 TaxID=3390998 RepID=UPI003D3175D1
MRALIAALLLLPGPALAEAMRATYEVQAAGMVVMELEAEIETSGDRYRVETRLRTRGLATLVASGEQVTRADGAFAGGAARPSGFTSEGVWRGRMRRIALAWQGLVPRVVELTPPETDEREPIPEPLRHGTMDVLSFALTVGRQAAQGGCGTEASVYDGRRLTAYRASGTSRDRIPPWGGAWQGEAMRCEVVGRIVGGFRHDMDRVRAAEPQRATAWMAAPYAGAPVVPVRMDIPTRWFGTANAVLLKAEPVLPRRAESGQPVERRTELRR